MFRMIRGSAVFALAVLILAAPAAHAAPRVFLHIGVPVPFAPPVAVAPAPFVAPAPPAPYGYVWRPAYPAWTGYAYRTIPGAWVRPPFARTVWVPPRLVARPHGFFWVGGYWRR